MLKNYLKIALRNLSKQKGYTFINTAGLAIGMGICLFLILLIQYSFNYDHHHTNIDRIYQLADEIRQDNGEILDVAISPSPWGKAMEADYPEIEESVRFLYQGRNIQYDDKILRQGVTYVDESIFRVFTYPFKYGNPEGALSRPNSIVLTEEMSVRYFADENPVGKTLLVNEEPLEVTGVLRKLPATSTFVFNSLAPFSSLTEEDYSSLENWRSHNLYTYVLLREGTDVEGLEAKFPEFIAKHVGEEYADRYKPHLASFGDLFLFTDLYGMHGETLDISYIYIFSAIGLLILFIACINFINLATAQGIKRAREIGIRKVIGAVKGQLIFQFITEALILASIAVMISLVFVEFALPWFNNMAEWEVTADYTSNPIYLISIVLTVLFVGLLAGGYPAFFLSSFVPAKVLKGDRVEGTGKSRLKTALVVTQFTVAIFMLISTISVDKQLSYLQTKDLGIETKDILVTQVPDDLTPEEFETVRSELFRIPGISEISFSSNIPGEEAGNRYQVFPEGTESNDGIMVNGYSVDPHFITQFDITVLEGRDFNVEFSSDTMNSVIINEAAAQKFGWENPVGKTLNWPVDGEMKPTMVVGLVKDFHYLTLHSAIYPLVLRANPNEFYDISIKLSGADTENISAQITSSLKEFNGGFPVSYYFLEDDLADEYSTETVIGEMLRYFTYLTLFIACLGLLGLVSYTVVNRRKEIGVRKVMGASVSSLVQNLSFRFVKLVIIGFLIGAPASWFLINEWLNSFAYSVRPDLTVFVLAGILTVTVAFLTIAYQTIKAATSNPIESLRND